MDTLVYRKNSILTAKKVSGFIVAILLTTISSFELSASEQSAKKSKTPMKCHVILMGGMETIHFVNSTMTNHKQLSQVLKNEKVTTSITKKAKQIYKVIECVPLDDTFKGDRAKQLDKKTVR